MIKFSGGSELERTEGIIRNCTKRPTW